MVTVTGYSLFLPKNRNFLAKMFLMLIIFLDEIDKIVYNITKILVWRCVV